MINPSSVTTFHIFPKSNTKVIEWCLSSCYQHTILELNYSLNGLNYSIKNLLIWLDHLLNLLVRLNLTNPQTHPGSSAHRSIPKRIWINNYLPGFTRFCWCMWYVLLSSGVFSKFHDSNLASESVISCLYKKRCNMHNNFRGCAFVQTKILL